MTERLKLQVALDLADRISQPLRNIMIGSQNLSGKVKELKQNLGGLEKVQQKLAGLKALKSDFAEVNTAIGKSTEKLAALNDKLRVSRDVKDTALAKSRIAKDAYRSEARAISALKEPTVTQVLNLSKLKVELEQQEKLKNRAINDYRRIQGKIDDENRLIKKNTEYRQSLKAQIAAQAAIHRNALNQIGIKTGDYIKQESILADKIKAVNNALNKQSSALDALNMKQSRLHANRAKYEKSLAIRDKFTNAGVTATAAAASLAAPIVLSVKEYANFEDAMLGIARQLPSARDESGKLTQVYYQMGNEIKRLAREIPLPTAQIADMVTAGARMEVPREQLIEYTKTVAAMSIAFDAVPDQIAEAMGKVAKNFKIPTEGIRNLADTINYLDDNAISKGDEIIEVLNRIGGVVSGKMSDKHAAALASTMLTLGERSETASTAISAIVTKFSAAESGTKKMRAALAQIGISPKDLQKSTSNDAIGSIFKVIEKIRALPKDQRMGVMVDIVGLEHSDTLAKLVERPEELKKQIGLANSQQAQGSMEREFDARKNTLSAKWQTTKNRFSNNLAEIGEKLRPSLVAALEQINTLLERFSAWIKANPALAAGLVKLATGVSIMAAAVAGAALTIAAFIGPIALARLSLGTLGIQLSSFFPKLSGLASSSIQTGSKLKSVWSGLGATATNTQKTMSKAWQSTDLGVVWQQAKQKTPGLLKGMGAGFIQKCNQAKQALVTFGIAAKQAFTVWLPLRFELAVEAMAFKAKRAALAITGIKTALSSTLTSIKLFFKSHNAVQILMMGLKAIGGAAMHLGRLLLSPLRILFFIARMATLLNPVTLVISAIAIIIYKYWKPIWAWLKGFWSGLVDGLKPLGAIFDQVFGALGTAFAPLKPAWEWFIGILKNVWDWVCKLFAPVNSTKESLDAATNSGKSFGEGLANIIVKCAEFVAKFITIGADIMRGLAAGIMSGLQWVKDAVLSVGDMLPQWLKDKLGIKSPSRVFAQIGSYTMQGLDKGIQQTHTLPLQTLTQTSKKLIAAGTLGLAVSSGSVLAQSITPTRTPSPQTAPTHSAPININITINAQAGANPTQLAQQIAQTVKQTLEQKQRQTAARHRSYFGDLD